MVYANGRTPSHAGVPTTAVIALQCGLSDGRTGDFAIIGHEGVVGSPLLTGSKKLPRTLADGHPARVLQAEAEALLSNTPSAPLAPHQGVEMHDLLEFFP